jgi:very-short-patch-repair endonuclease
MRKKYKKESRLARARDLRRTMTDAERTLWERLRQLPSGMSHFRRQDAIGPYFAGFACRARRIVIDVAGDQRGPVGTFRKDEPRAKKLEVRGYRVLRFGHSDVLSNIDGVMQTIRASLVGDQPAPS